MLTVWKIKLSENIVEAARNAGKEIIKYSKIKEETLRIMS